MSIFSLSSSSQHHAALTVLHTVPPVGSAHTKKTSGQLLAYRGVELDMCLFPHTVMSRVMLSLPGWLEVQY